MSCETKLPNQQDSSDGIRTIEKYELAARFMSHAAEKEFGITISEPVANCWVSTLRLMYYADHVLDGLESPEDRRLCGLHFIECMFADPLDWELVTFGNPELDEALDSFRYDVTRLAVDPETADTTLDLFERTEALRAQTDMNDLVDARVREAETCADLLLQIDNSRQVGSAYSEWLTRFWRFGNLVDLFIDLNSDIDAGILQTPDNIKNRTTLAIASLRAGLRLMIQSSPYLLGRYVKAGSFVISDRPKPNTSISPHITSST